MGITDDLKRSFGEDFFHPVHDREPYRNWHALCVCGHIDRYHAPVTGGTYELPPARVQTVRGEEVTILTVFDGCNGAMPGRGFESETTVANHETNTVTVTVVATCPCRDFRPVARVDRPNRYFNQRLPRDRADHARHPMMVGIRAFLTHLSKRKAAQTDPAWVTAEFDRRFTWLPDMRVCSMSSCKATDDVWPVFVNAEDHSELRCPKHR